MPSLIYKDNLSKAVTYIDNSYTSKSDFDKYKEAAFQVYVTKKDLDQYDDELEEALKKIVETINQNNQCVKVEIKQLEQDNISTRTVLEDKIGEVDGELKRFKASTEINITELEKWINVRNLWLWLLVTVGAFIGCILGRLIVL